MRDRSNTVGPRGAMPWTTSLLKSCGCLDTVRIWGPGKEAGWLLAKCCCTIPPFMTHLRQETRAPISYTALSPRRTTFSVRTDNVEAPPLLQPGPPSGATKYLSRSRTKSTMTAVIPLSSGRSFKPWSFTLEPFWRQPSFPPPEPEPPGPLGGDLDRLRQQPKQAPPAASGVGGAAGAIPCDCTEPPDPPGTSESWSLAAPPVTLSQKPWYFVVPSGALLAASQANALSTWG